MRKYLALIAGAAVAYGLVGAAASSLQVAQTVVPAQGSVGAGLVGQCTPAVVISYRYQKSMLDENDQTEWVNALLEEGDATNISQIIVTPVDTDTGTTAGDPDCNYDEGPPEAGDRVALSFSNASPGFLLDPVENGETQDVDTTADPVAYVIETLDDETQMFLASQNISHEWGGWVFNTYVTGGGTNPVFISDFDPGSITVTLWRVPAPVDPVPDNGGGGGG